MYRTPVIATLDNKVSFLYSCKTGIDHMVIGVRGTASTINRSFLSTLADRGTSRYYWEPQDDMDILNLATQIVDDIAGTSCKNVVQ